MAIVLVIFLLGEGTGAAVAQVEMESMQACSLQAQALDGTPYVRRVFCVDRGRVK